jgi:hypothetical protein
MMLGVAKQCRFNSVSQAERLLADEAKQGPDNDSQDGEGLVLLGRGPSLCQY